MGGKGTKEEEEEEEEEVQERLQREAAEQAAAAAAVKARALAASSGGGWGVRGGGGAGGRDGDHRGADLRGKRVSFYGRDPCKSQDQVSVDSDRHSSEELAVTPLPTAVPTPPPAQQGQAWAGRRGEEGVAPGANG